MWIFLCLLIDHEPFNCFSCGPHNLVPFFHDVGWIHSCSSRLQQFSFSTEKPYISAFDSWWRSWPMLDHENFYNLLGCFSVSPPLCYSLTLQLPNRSLYICGKGCVGKWQLYSCEGIWLKKVNTYQKKKERIWNHLLCCSSFFVVCICLNESSLFLFWVMNLEWE